MDGLIKDYRKVKNRIRTRLREFQQVWQAPDDRIFEEMVFCLCTPQSSAKSCFIAVADLVNSSLLLTGDEIAISRTLRGYVRFHNTKSRYILGARRIFSDRSGKLRIKEVLRHQESLELREWLVRNILGLGYKEAGHFLRNIGRGDNLAILDRHILRNMIRYRVIQQMPITLTRRTYLDMEKKLSAFSNQINIPMAELDLLFWYRETGEIFK